MTRTAPQPRVAIATAAELPDLDDEGRLLLDALAEVGLDARPATWTDAAEDWSVFDLVVVRTTWDYPPVRDAYLAWADRVGAASRLLNDPAVLRWNTDKRYLAELTAAGVPVVPTTFVGPHDDPTHGLLDVEHVVKPTVSAGSKDTLRLGADEAERSLAHLRAVTAGGRSAMVQPYLTDVDIHGETALVFFDGVFSHAIRKGPILTRGAGLVDGLFAEEEIEPRTPSDAERAVADAVLAQVPGEAPLYARVDLLGSDDGPVLLELELTEPSLFLEHADGAAQRLARATLARLR